jgi:regulator of protease activity HflC (stomatin/prohibitin superfamily)
MFTFILSIIFGLITLAVFILPLGALGQYKKFISIISGVIASILFVAGSVSYNDSGKCTHVQTIFGSEARTCETGWYFSGWGRTTEYPHYITVANASDESYTFGSAVNKPYSVRMSDNWNGDITQNTRFAIPQDETQFMNMHHTFRSPERLIQTTLKPAVTSSLDSVANLFSMEEYYAGGKRDQFKTEYKDAVEKGRAMVKQVVVDGLSLEYEMKAQANDLTDDTSNTNNRPARKIIMEKITDSKGIVVREIHDYVKYGISVSSAIVENLDPDDKFENQIQDRKLSASKRMVAQEQRKEQEEQRLLAIQTGQTQIAKRQAEAQVEQIQKTTEAETAKKLIIIQAEQAKAQATIATETAKLQLDKARIDAEATKTLADAEAYSKKAIIMADGALEKKLAAYVETQKAWAEAASKMNVPQQLFGASVNGTNIAGSTTEQFMQLLTMKSAKDLAVYLDVKK